MHACMHAWIIGTYPSLHKQATGRKYLLCDYNRDGDSYRSPWSNAYEPPIEGDDGFQPSPALRAMEVG